MGGKSAKQKGSKFEREVADLLSQVFGEPFTRTLSSGAFIGGKNKHRKSGLSNSMINSSLGDIVTPDGWNFVIECKNYADINFNGIVMGDCQKLSGWIDEVRYDTDGLDNHMVVFRISRAGTYLALPRISEFHSKLLEIGTPHTVYPHAYIVDEENELYDNRWYLIMDWDILLGAYEDEPGMQETLKSYILHLAQGYDPERKQNG